MSDFQVNEVFYSLQGEGARAGSANVFIRFSGCNLQCRRETEGFDCDTEFVSGRPRSADDLVVLAVAVSHGQNCGVILTGGEPALQVTRELVTALHEAAFAPICIETNGTRDLDLGLDWISCSPKTAEHTLRLKTADELRYVRRAGMGIPRPSIKATHHFISPACGPDGIGAEDLAWCIALVKENTLWRLSEQQHKRWGVR